jgi:hypothetical protein
MAQKNSFNSHMNGTESERTFFLHSRSNEKQQNEHVQCSSHRLRSSPQSILSWVFVVTHQNFQWLAKRHHWWRLPVKKHEKCQQEDRASSLAVEDEDEGAHPLVEGSL